MTPAQRKALERQRKAAQGLKEVRGIWAKQEHHAFIKAASVCAIERAKAYSEKLKQEKR